MTLSHKTAVFFDMDETLIQHDRTMVEICHDMYEAHADQLEPIEESDFLKTLWQKAGDMWNMMIDGAITGEVALPYTIINTLRALEADPSLAESISASFQQGLIDSTRLADDALQVMTALRESNRRVGIVTNGYTSTQGRKIRHHDLDQYADFVLISEAVGSHKPHGGIFREALSRADVEASQALFVGDNINTDILGSVNAGMDGILIDRNGGRDETLPEAEDGTKPFCVIERLSEVLPLVGLNDGA